jgi:hypothetical protein
MAYHQRSSAAEKLRGNCCIKYQRTEIHFRRSILYAQADPDIPGYSCANVFKALLLKTMTRLRKEMSESDGIY